MTVVRVATYPVDSGRVQELIDRANEELVPIYKGQPGFQSLSVVHAGDEIVSISHWDTSEQAAAGAAAAMDWAKAQSSIGPASSNRIGEELASA